MKCFDVYKIDDKRKELLQFYWIRISTEIQKKNTILYECVQNNTTKSMHIQIKWLLMSFMKLSMVRDTMILTPVHIHIHTTNKQINTHAP